MATVRAPICCEPLQDNLFTRGAGTLAVFNVCPSYVTDLCSQPAAVRWCCRWSLNVCGFSQGIGEANGERYGSTSSTSTHYEPVHTSETFVDD